jgi:hypothetical protein
MATDGPYDEFYYFYSVNSEYFGYTHLIYTKLLFGKLRILSSFCSFNNVGTGTWLRAGISRIQIPAQAKDFSLLQIV